MDSYYTSYFNTSYKQRFPTHSTNKRIIRNVSTSQNKQTVSDHTVFRHYDTDCVQKQANKLNEVRGSNGQTYTRNGVPYAVWLTGCVQTMWSNHYDGTGVVVAVIDDGVDRNHDSLRSCMDGRVKVIREVDLSVAKQPTKEHGTLVAGLIAGYAQDGYKGVAPNAQIISYNVFEPNGNASSQILANAINLAVSQGCHIINLSLGSQSPSTVVLNAIDRAYSSGILVLASSGNEGVDTINYPAYYSPVVSVGSLQYNLTDASFIASDFTSTNNQVDISAVGSDVVVCLPNNAYGLASGTSFSCPITSGCAALLRSRYLEQRRLPNNTRINVQKQRLWLQANSVDLFARGVDDASGCGLVCFLQSPPSLTTYSV